MGLRDDNNSWCTIDSQIADIKVGFYNNLFTTASPTDAHAIMKEILPLVTEDINNNLIREFTKQEVDLALKNIEPLKALGLDGMPPFFFQSFWPMIGDDVSKAILDCLNLCHIPNEFNYTYVTLIPKVKNPEKISEFIRISLCNVI